MERNEGYQDLGCDIDGQILVDGKSYSFTETVIGLLDTTWPDGNDIRWGATIQICIVNDLGSNLEKAAARLASRSRLTRRIQGELPVGARCANQPAMGRRYTVFETTNV